MGDWEVIKTWGWLAFLAVGSYECWSHGINIDLALFLFLCVASVVFGIRYVIADKRQ